jgi:hypothetical protein
MFLQITKYFGANKTEEVEIKMILRHADTFLGNERERSSYKRAVTEERILKTSMSVQQKLEAITEKGCFLCGPCREVISSTVGAMSNF